MKRRTKPNSSHPDRDEMLRALRTSEVPFRDHLAACSSCRRAYDFLKVSRLPEAADLAAPSTEAYQRHSRLPLIVSDWLPRRTITGESIHDSWTGLPVTVTRDSAMGLERSLRLASGTVSLELVADRTLDGWHFAARCYRDDLPSGEFILKIGKQRIAPGMHDCYTWTALKPPRTIQLLSPSVRLVFETGLW